MGANNHSKRQNKPNTSLLSFSNIIDKRGQTKMQTITKIIDASTDQLSEALKLIWRNKAKLEGDPELKRIKEHVDTAQTILLNLMCSLEDYDKIMATEFYACETHA